MEAELTPVKTTTQSWDGTIRTDSSSALTVDFDHFYKFWTNAKGNFTDPKGFCDLATVRPIWQSPAARKSVDCVGECVVVIRHLLIVTQPPSAPFFRVPSFTISAADPVCCRVPVRLPARPPARPPPHQRICWGMVTSERVLRTATLAVSPWHKLARTLNRLISG